MSDNRFENKKKKCLDEIQIFIERIEILRTRYLSVYPNSPTYLTTLDCCMRCLDYRISQLKSICAEYGVDYRKDIHYRKLIFELEILDISVESILD